MNNLTNKDLGMILSDLEDSEKECLPFACNIIQKIVGVLMREPGRAKLVDVFRYVSTNLSLLNEMNSNG